MADANRIKAKGIDGILEIESNGNQLVIHTLYGDETINREDALEERCTVCKSKKHVIYDELMGEEGEANPQCGRFDKVAQLEAMSPEAVSYTHLDVYKRQMIHSLRQCTFLLSLPLRTRCFRRWTC